MDISADVDRIIAQAPEWNLAGDCDLLALMKRISQNLYERGERTSRNLQEFETRVRQADISLSNATNSLRSLQFGHQFVEYRVEEMDDADLAMPEEKKKKPDPPPMSSEEMARGFLDNNLRMFRKNFEPVTIDVPDSDDEEAPVSSTTVFRAKNPYDAIPLPYIIGTKEWEEHKYAGLYDSGENSGDDKSDEFSSSSSDEGKEFVSRRSTQPENKLVEPHLSDSSSLASFAREPAIVSPVRTLNQTAPVVPPAKPPASQVPEAAIRTQPRPIISSQRNPHERDMFAALRQSPPSDDPPSTSSSPASSPAFRNPSSGGRLPIASAASLSSSSSSPAHQPPPQPKLFEEAEAIVSTQSPKESEPKPSQIKRKPVNLFNDDEFNSFMSEIVGKVQAKAGAAAPSPARETPQAQAAAQEAPPRHTNLAVAPQSGPKRVNLFDDSPPLSPIPRPESLPSVAPALGAIPKQTPPKELKVGQPKAFIPKETAKPLPKSLFDDDLEDDDFLSSLTPKSKPPDQEQRSKPRTSLFDDDDLDINDIFAKPSSTTSTNKLSERVAGKTSLFDDDDDQEDDTDLFSTRKSKSIKDTPRESPVKKVEPPEAAPKKSLFDDIEEEDLFATPKATARYNESQPQPLETDLEINGQSKPIEIEPETLNKQEITVQQQQLLTNTSPSSSPVFRESPPPFKSAAGTRSEMEKGRNLSDDEAPTKPPAKHIDLFGDELSDEDREPRGASEANEFIKTADERVKEEEKSPTTIDKHPNLFSEDFSDEDRFLSASFKETMEVSKTSKDQLVEEIKTKELPHKLPENKLEDELIVVESAGPSDIQMVVPVAEKPPPDDYQSHQDPIIAMVADVTNKSEKDDPTKRTPADLAAAQQILQNYSSLFSDEPPDDSEFFQTLGSSGLSSLSASKIFDNEQDFFEPALPKVPSATTPGDQPPTTSDYGVGLFSDVPPEDEEDIDAASSKAAKRPEDVAPTTTRIHTIFYDDFSETARAGSVQPSRQASLYDEEPPPSGDEPDRSQVKEASDLPKKLKMPNIKINVQALLPGSGGGLPKLLKKQESSSFDERAESPKRAPSPESIRKRTDMPSTEGGLQHVNKTRARGPAKRRPSTRKGRKENYVKSLIEDEQGPEQAPAESFLASPDDDSKSLSLTNSLAVDVVNSPPSTISQPDRATVSSQKISAPNSSNSFLDSPDEDDSLFGPSTTKSIPFAKQNAGNQTVTATPVSAAPVTIKPLEDRRQSVIPRKNNDPPASYRSFLDSPDEEDSLFSPPRPKDVSADKKVTLPNDTSTARREAETFSPPKVASSFMDSSDDDDFLFRPDKAVPAPVPQKSPAPATEKPRDSAPSTVPRTEEPPKEQIKPKSQAVPRLFDDSDDDDDLFASSAVPAPAVSVPSSSRPVQTQQPAKPAAGSLFSSDEDDAKAPDNVPKKKLPLKTTKSLFSDDDDDDDLFGGGSRPKASAIKKTKPIARTASKPAPSKTPMAAVTIPDSVSDNPLADLLDFE